MQLNEKQLTLLTLLEATNDLAETLEDKVAKKLKWSVDLVEVHYNELEREGFIRLVETPTNPNRYRRALITAKGKVAIENPEDLIQPNSTIPMTNNISISSPNNSPINILQDSDNNTVTITQNIDQNAAEIIKSLEQLKQTIQTLPTDEKEDAEDFLNYIQEEIEKPSEQRDESKIVKNLKRFCKIAFPFVLSGIINGVDFTNNVTDLATKFNVELPQLLMIK